MVTLDEIRSSNSKIATALPPGMVAVFAGATSGIGEASMKQFAKNSLRPRLYFIGRSKESGNRIQTELHKLNPEGEYIYKSVDVSLLHSVDNVCREIMDKEKAINLLFLSTGTPLSGNDTKEGLNYTIAVSYYARARFIVNLLPILQNATGLCRVVTVLAGTKEGPVNTDDFQGRNSSMLSLRGHFSSMVTLLLEEVAKHAPNVSFIHVYPGFVKSNHERDLKLTWHTVLRVVFDAILLVIGPLILTPVDEAGERHLFLSTSSRFPPQGNGAAIGVYSVSNDGEGASPKVQELLQKLREDGVGQKVWSNVKEEFIRITGVVSI